MGLWLKYILDNLDLYVGPAYFLLKTTKEQENLKKQEIQDIFIKTSQKKAYFQDDMPDEDFEDLASGTASDKVLRDKGCNFAKN